MLKLFLSLLLFLFLTCPATAADPKPSEKKPTTYEKAVKDCVSFVHNYKTSGIDEPFFKEFDAFYNPSNGKVQTNAYLNGHQQPFFRFRKCLAEKGFPASD